MLLKSLQSGIGGREWSYLARLESPHLPSQDRGKGKGKERMRLPLVPLFQRQVWGKKYQKSLGNNNLGKGSIQQYNLTP